jgi:hypothetical protein
MNRKTAHARKKGFCSTKDMEQNGNKIFKGSECDTSWDNPKSNRNSPHRYGKKSES